MVNSNRFWDELSTDNNKFKRTQETFTCSKKSVGTLEKTVKFVSIKTSYQ